MLILQKIKVKAAQNLSEEEAAVFDAHINMANDPELLSQTTDKIKSEITGLGTVFISAAVP